VAEIRERCSSRHINFDEQHRTRQERYFDFGPRWRNLQSLGVGEREALAELQLGQDFVADVDKWSLHPALLDLATGPALYLIQDYEDSKALYLPLSYKRISFYRPLPRRFYSHIRCRQENTTQREMAVFSFTLLDPDGRVLAEIDEFALRRMATTSDGPKPALLPWEGAPYSEPAELVEYRGMTTADGIKALDQILSSDMPPGIIVLRGDLPGNPPRPSATASPLTRAAKPEGEIESVLAEWWRELLGVETVGLDDDFFNLGGHSLIAVRMFSKIKKTYQQDLSLSTLFEARTIRQLATLIRAAGTSSIPEVGPPSAVQEPHPLHLDLAVHVETRTIRESLSVNHKSKRPVTAGAKSWSALVPIQPNGSRTPLFCVHALGPSLLFYRQLATYLGSDQPFYAMQSPLEFQARIRESSIEELASLYLKELQTFFPQGPYLLGGASLGGLIALEMCQQLHTKGEKPGLLILFDAAVPGCDHHVALKEQVSRHWQNLRDQGPVYLVQKVVSKSEYLRFRLSRSAQAAACSCYQLLGRSLPANLHYFQVEEAHKRALERYIVQFYPEKITLMRAADLEETVATRRNATLGWETLTGGGLEIHDVPGGHTSMFEELNVRVLAERLKAILSSTDSATENETAEKLSLVSGPSL